MKGLVDACSSNTVGLIYAGGKATRMGGINKAFACFEGRRLIDHVLDTLRAQCSRVIISANRDLDEFAGMADAVLPDVGTDFPGPLGALAAFSLLHLPDCEWVLTAPCDAPRAPRTLLLQFAAAQREASDRGSASSAFLLSPAGGRSRLSHFCMSRRCRPLRAILRAMGNVWAGRFALLALSRLILMMRRHS